jgi:hypothetical protein
VSASALIVGSMESNGHGVLHRVCCERTRIALLSLAAVAESASWLAGRDSSSSSDSDSSAAACKFREKVRQV